MAGNLRRLIRTLGDAIGKGAFVSNATRPPILVYHHVPKTAGTSMRYWLRNTFGRRRVFWNDSDKGRIIDDVVQTRGVEHFRRYAAIGGHIEFASPSIQALPQPKIFSAVFRKPVDQVISHFEFVSRRPQNVLHTGGTLESALTSNTAFLRASTNNQCRLVTGSTNAVDALKVIEQNEFILGCFDNLPKFMDSVATTLDVPQRDLPRRNVQDNNYFDKHYSPRVEDLIREITQEDEAVYQFVLKKGVNVTVRGG